MANNLRVTDLAVNLQSLNMGATDTAAWNKHITSTCTIKPSFLTLPQELRDHIYSFLPLVTQDDYVRVGRRQDDNWDPMLLTLGAGCRELKQYNTLAATCRITYQDASKIFYRHNKLYVLHQVEHKEPIFTITAPSWLRRSSLAKDSNIIPSCRISTLRIWGTEREIQGERSWDSSSYYPALHVSWCVESGCYKVTLSLETPSRLDKLEKGIWEDMMTEATKVVIDRINHYLAEKQHMDADTVEMVAKHWVYAQQLMADETGVYNGYVLDYNEDVRFETVDTPSGPMWFLHDDRKR